MELKHIQEEISKILGTKPLLPKWAFGWHLGQKGI
jgi:alpha-glucosidase